MATPGGKRKLGEDSVTTEYVPRRWLADGETHHPLEICSERGSLFVERGLTAPSSVDVWNETSQRYESYRLVFGSEQAAVFLQHSDVPEVSIRSASFEDVAYCLQRDLYSVDKLTNFFNGSGDLRDLMALQHVLPLLARLFRVIPAARISISTFDRPLGDAKWYQVYDQRSRRSTSLFLDPEFDLGIAFACIAYLIAGVNVDPDIMEPVFAMAYEDSLYVDMRVSILQV